MIYVIKEGQMARKNKKKGKGASHFLVPANAMEEFANNATHAAIEAIDNAGKDHDRLIALSGGSDIPESGKINIIVNLTDGAAALFPFVPRDTAAEYDRKYFAKMRELRERYGDNFAEWPKNRELAPVMQNGDLVGVTFYVERVRSHEVSFTFTITVVLNGKPVMVKDQFDIDIDIDDDDEVITIRNDARSIHNFLERQMDHWLFNPKIAWENADMRSASDLLTNVAARTWIAAMTWHQIRIETFHKGVATVFYFDSETALSQMRESALKEECRKLIGNYFNPGNSAAFILGGIIRADGAMDISLRGPFSFDPCAIHYLHEILDLAQDAPLLFSEKMPSPADSDDYINLDLGVANQVLEALEIDPPWNQDSQEGDEGEEPEEPEEYFE